MTTKQRHQADHVRLHADELICDHCEEREALPTPCLLSVLCDKTTAFAAQHRACRAPTVQRPAMEYQSVWEWLDGPDARHMCGLEPHPSWGACSPVDPSDFGRCYRLLQWPWASKWRARIGEMARYPGWSGLAPRWAELEALYLEELSTGSGPKLYAAMQAARGKRA